jgi:hypothetical protein
MLDPVVVNPDDSNGEGVKIPDGYDTVTNCKSWLGFPEGFSDGFFWYHVYVLHRRRGVEIFKLNGKTYYRKDLLREQAEKDGLLKSGV